MQFPEVRSYFGFPDIHSRLVSLSQQDCEPYFKGSADLCTLPRPSPAFVSSRLDYANCTLCLQRLNNTNRPSFKYCYMDVRAGCCLGIWKGEPKHLKTNFTGGCSAHHTENTKRGAAMPPLNKWLGYYFLTVTRLLSMHRPI